MEKNDRKKAVKSTKKQPSRAKKKSKKTIKGRPTSYEAKYAEEAKKLATIGINEEDIAWYLGVHPETFRRWKKRHPALSGAVKEGVANKKVSLSKAMFNNAISRGNAAVQIFLAKNWLGMRDRQDVEHSGGGKDKLPIKIIYENEPPNNNDDKNGANGSDTAATGK